MCFKDNSIVYLFTCQKCVQCCGRERARLCYVEPPSTLTARDTLKKCFTLISCVLFDELSIFYPAWKVRNSAKKQPTTVMILITLAKGDRRRDWDANFSRCKTRWDKTKVNISTSDGETLEISEIVSKPCKDSIIIIVTKKKQKQKVCVSECEREMVRMRVCEWDNNRKYRILCCCVSKIAKWNNHRKKKQNRKKHEKLSKT